MALRSKWQRMMIAAAGMIVELTIAAVAVIVWSQTSQGSVLHGLMYNVMFVSVCQHYYSMVIPYCVMMRITFYLIIKYLTWHLNLIVLLYFKNLHFRVRIYSTSFK